MNERWVVHTLHSCCVQQGRKGIILATFTRPRVGAFDTFGQLCCHGGGEFDSFFQEMSKSPPHAWFPPPLPLGLNIDRCIASPTLLLLHFHWFPGMADLILVNSNFTAETFKSTFKSLCNQRPRVLYPSLNFSTFDVPLVSEETDDLLPPSAKFVFLSINRYERKKNLKLALEALNWLKNLVTDEEWKGVHLIMAGKLVLQEKRL